MRKSKRVKAGLVACDGRGEELGSRVSVDGGGEGMLREARRKKIEGGVGGVAGRS